MSLSSESGFIEWADIRVDSLRMDNPRGQMESCVDFFVLFKENNEHDEPGVHISIPLDKAKELADGIYDHMPKGHWKSIKGNFESYVKCPICGKCSIDQRTYVAMNFCPNCGADMSEPKSEWEQDHEILKAYSNGANEVLDKIKEHAEINQNLNTVRARALCYCLDVIDRYKEQEDGNTN